MQKKKLRLTSKNAERIRMKANFDGEAHIAAIPKKRRESYKEDAGAC